MKKKNSLLNNENKVNELFFSNDLNINYLEVEVLKKFITPEGKILPSRRTGLNAINQRKMAKSIKRARVLALLPFCDFDQ